MAERPWDRKLLFVSGFQLSAVLVATFVPFGFDRPSSWGLDFGHLLALGALYAVALLAGLALCVAQRRWWLALGEIALPCVWFALGVSGLLP